MRSIQCPLEHRVDCRETEASLRARLEEWIQCPLEHRVDCREASAPTGGPLPGFNARLSIEWIAADAVLQERNTWGEIQCPLEHRVDCRPPTCASHPASSILIQCPLEHRVDCRAVQHAAAGDTITIQCPLEHRVDCRGHF